MKIVAEFDFNGGKANVFNNYPQEIQEVQNIISMVDASKCKIKESYEKTMKGKMLYSPKALNRLFKEEFHKYGWKNYSVECKYIFGTYLSGYIPSNSNTTKPFRDMDFLKKGKKLGIEVQFGKYASADIFLEKKDFDILELVQDTGYQPKVSFEEGIKKTAEYMIENGIS